MTDLQDLSRRLFAAADQLWTNTDLRPRQMEVKFETVDAELRKTFKGRLKPTPADYQARSAIFLPENARFSRLLSLPANPTSRIRRPAQQAVEPVISTYWFQCFARDDHQREVKRGPFLPVDHRLLPLGSGL